MKFQAKLEEQIARYKKDLENVRGNDTIRLESKIEGLQQALMYYNSRDSWGNVTKKPGRLGTTEE